MADNRPVTPPNQIRDGPPQFPPDVREERAAARAPAVPAAHAAHTVQPFALYEVIMNMDDGPNDGPQ